MKTVEALYKKYNDKFPRLDQVAADYYGVSDIKTIQRMASKRQFGDLRPFRARDSSKSPYLVDIQNLADVLDQRSRART